MKGLLFVYAMTYGGAAVSLFNPFFGLLIYVAFANLRPTSLWFWSLPPGNYSRTIAVAFLLGWLINGKMSWKFGAATPIVLALLFYWAWLILGALTTPAQTDAWSSLEILSKIYLPFIAGLTMLDSVSKLKQLAWVLVLSEGYLALHFNQQYLSYGFDDMSWRFGTLDNNGMAIEMVCALGLTFFVGLQASKWWQRLTAAVLGVAMAHFVLFSMSRGGMLAMCVTGAVAFVLIPKSPKHYLALVVVGLIVLRLAGPSVREEFFSSFAAEEERDWSAQSRFLLTRNAIDCMLKHPITGCGMENWGNVAPEYGWPKGKRVHNTWAEIGATLGIPGLMSILAFYAIANWKLLLLWRRQTYVADPILRGFARAVLAATAGFVVSAYAVTAHRVELPYYVVLLGAGVLRVHSLGLVESRDTDPESLPAAERWVATNAALED